jgi:type II secretory pathway component PulJ
VRAGRGVAHTLRHNETFRTGTHQNGPEQAEALGVKTGANQSGTKRTEAHSPLSRPRYRGSNPCLPANSLTFGSLIDWSAGLSGVAPRCAVRIGSGTESLPPSHYNLNIFSNFRTHPHRTSGRSRTTCSGVIEHRLVATRRR